ncbi:MAG TPA: aldo/keto reductase, partial [Mycobacteriales bacterium]|nr:aldo/keto reductase [Mycobacteriales bacterium]
MEQRAVGRSGLVVSRLGLGTATWGRDTDPDDAAAQLVAFREAGGTLLDVGPWYVCEQTEPLVGRLLRDVVPRDELVLAVKSGGPVAPGAATRGASRGGLLTALDNTLLRLGVDSVDLWQVHGWNDAVPLEEVLSAVDTAVT